MILETIMAINFKFYILVIFLLKMHSGSREMPSAALVGQVVFSPGIPVFAHL